MVRTLVFILSFLASTSLWPAQLSLQLDKAQATVGEPILLRISAPMALNDLDLGALQNDFEVFARAASFSTTRGKSSGVLEATLYPLRSGHLNLPALHMGKLQSRAQSIDIAPPNIALSTWLEPLAPMERQAATLYLQLQDEGDVSITPPQIDAPHIAWSPLPEIGAAENSGKRLLRWRILPLQNGSLTIHFPMLDAYRFGQRLRFPLPALSFRAARAPLYLPLYLPIGQPKLVAEALPQSLIMGQPYNWNIYIDAPGLSPEGALQLVQYNKAYGLHFYAPSATRVQRDGREWLQFSLNFYATGNAPIFPSLHLAYFDPAQDMLRTVVLPGRQLTARDPTLRKQLIALATAVLTLLLVAAANAMRPIVRGWRARRRWLSVVGASQNTAQLYHALTRAAPWAAPTIARWPRPLAAQIEQQLRDELDALRFRSSLAPSAAASPQGRDTRENEHFVVVRQRWKIAAAALPLKFFAS